MDSSTPQPNEPIRLLVIINPHASTVANMTADALAQQVREVLDAMPLPPVYEILIPDSPEHMREAMTEKIASGAINRVAVAGGDGTVQETLPVIKKFPQVALGLIPQGTGNLLALSIGVNANLHEALDVIVSGDVRTVDLGIINGRTFILNASIGIDAEIMKKTDKHIKKRLGRWAYWVTGFSILPNAKHARIRIETDKQVIWTRAIGINISNTRMQVPGGIVLSPEAQLDDGYLHATIFKMRRFWDWVEGLGTLIFNPKGERHGMVESFNARRIKIEAHPALNTQADGNVIGKTPAIIELSPYKLSLCVPKSADSKDGNEDFEELSNIVEMQQANRA